MVDSAQSFSLVSLVIDNPPVVFPDIEALAHVNFSAPAPSHITIAVTSSNPNVLSVDTPTIDADAGDLQSFVILLNPQAQGTAVITATLGNSVQLEVHVGKNPKEGKEGKETGKESKEHAGKELEFAPPKGLSGAGNPDGGGQAGSGRAFIRSDERPALRLQGNPDKRKGADAGHSGQPL